MHRSTSHAVITALAITSSTLLSASVADAHVSIITREDLLPPGFGS